jgi:urocanate hydratase
VFKTHENAPRVLIANSNLVANWSNWDEFRRLEALGLIMYGQMTAGSWIYIGTQGILQGTYECFAAVATKHFGDSLAGRLVVTAGLGGMGGAQPLAATMNEATCLVAEVDRTRIQRRLDKKYLDELAPDLESGIRRALEARDRKEAVSIGVECNAVDLLDALVAKGIVPDVLTDQTSAHDELNGYVPAGMSFGDALTLRASDPEKYKRLSHETMARHMRGMLELQRRGSITFDYGNNLRGQAIKHGVANAFDVEGFVPLFIRPLFCEGKGPFRWAALSGNPADIRVTDEAILELFRRTRRCTAGSGWPRTAWSFRGCRRGSAGLGTGSARRRGSRSTTSSRRGRSRRRS